MKKIVVIIFAILWGCTCYCQKTADNKTAYNNFDTMRLVKAPYCIDYFSIDPKSKTVSEQQEVGGVNWDGYRYVVDPAIHYKTTSLIIFGSRITFKELFPYKGNLNAVKIIGCTDQDVTFKDKTGIYDFVPPDRLSKIDVAPYKAIGNDIYQDNKGHLYFIYERELQKLSGQTFFDARTLKHLAGNYYTDKNGLYILGKHYHPELNMYPLEAIKVEDSQATSAEPFVTPRYFIYNNHVYSLTSQIDRLKLDPANLTEIEWDSGYNNFYSITDGKQTYDTHGAANYSDSIKDPYSDRHLMLKHTVDYFSKNNISIKNVFSRYIRFAQKDTSTLYIPLGESIYDNNPATTKNGVLLNTSDGFYFLNVANRTADPQKIKKVLVYNIDTKKDEDFNPTEFSFLGNNVCIYRNHLFIAYHPVCEQLDLKNLRFISNIYFKTYFMTDGKILIYANWGSLYETKTVNGQEEIVLDKRIIKGVNIPKLRIINQERLMDDQYLYSADTIFPVYRFGLDVKTCLAQ